MSGYPLPGEIDDFELDAKILAANDACEQLEVSRSEFIARIEFCVSEKLSDADKLRQIESIVSEYNGLRDSLMGFR